MSVDPSKLNINFNRFWFDILEMAQSNNRKVFGIQAQNIGMSSMLFLVKSVGFKAMESLKDGVMIT